MEDDYKAAKYWKLGIFYFNKNDKRIFPPKRNPYMGWTINFANPISILVFLIVTIAIIFGIEFLVSNADAKF